MRVSVLLAPGAGEVPQDAAAVAIDVLRATTTLATAFAGGALSVRPFASVEEARAAKQADPGALLCGERDGRIVPGFDLGNSPFEYGPETMAGRRLLFASTNGSLALLRAGAARRVLLGAFVNASATAAALAGERRVVLVCAGKLGAFALEDAACAGWLCARLADAGAELAGPEARLARALAPRGAAEVRAVLEGSDHGRTLRGMGPDYARDVARCAALDLLDRACEPPRA
jgi:2-phosphosulfolactate phosphatase